MPDVNRRFLETVVTLVRSDFRYLFGMEFTNQCGHFVDQYLSMEVHSFADWIDYPKGDRVLKEHSSKVLALAITSDGRFSFSGQSNGKIVMFDLVKKYEVIQEWKVQSEGVTVLAYHSSGLLCSGATDGIISLWNSFDECKHIRNLTGHASMVLSLDFNHKATQIVSGSTDSSIRLWSVKTGECLRKFNGHSSFVYSALFIDDLIISGSVDEKIRLWRPDQSECIRVIENHGSINQVCINSDSTLIVALLRYDFVLFKWPEMEIIRIIKQSAFYGQFHPIHPHLLAVGYRSGKSVRIYNVMSEECVRRLEGHTGNVRDMCFTPDGYRLISVSEDKTTRVWDVSDLQ